MNTKTIGEIKADAAAARKLESERNVWRRQAALTLMAGSKPMSGELVRMIIASIEKEYPW